MFFADKCGNYVDGELLVNGCVLRDLWLFLGNVGWMRWRTFPIPLVHSTCDLVCGYVSCIWASRRKATCCGMRPCRRQTEHYTTRGTHSRDYNVRPCIYVRTCTGFISKRLTTKMQQVSQTFIKNRKKRLPRSL